MNSLGKSWFGALAAILTGCLFGGSLDVGPIGSLALIAPMPVLLYALSAPRAWSVSLVAAGARALGLAGVLYVYDKLPLIAVVLWVASLSLIYAAVVLLTRWIARDAPPAFAVFAYPSLLATVEWLSGMVLPHGSYGAMGYSLVDVLPLLQVASIGGLAALTFCVALVPMAIAVAIARAGAARAALVAGGVPFALALAFGAWRLSQPYESHARVALVGLDAYEARAFAGEKEDAETAQAFAEQVRAVAREHPAFIVLPEKQLGGARETRASGALLASAAAAAAPATLVAGFDEVLPQGPRVNSAQIFMPGQPMRRYLKRRLIPGAELGYATGVESFVDGTSGVAICKDMDFPALIRDYGRRGVELLLVPAWDFVLDGRMHSRMALVRGVENGFAVARAAAAGRLTASDRYGRVIAEKTTSRAAPITVVADLGLRRGGTFYARFGDVFAWGCAALALMLSVRRGLFPAVRESKLRSHP